MSTKPVTRTINAGDPETFPTVLAAELTHLGIHKDSTARPDLKGLFHEIAKRPPETALRPSVRCFAGSNSLALS